jgi:hypothetical protein
MEEKEAARAVQIEDVSGAGDVGYDSAELEPRMNLQTIMAFIVRSTTRRHSPCGSRPGRLTDLVGSGITIQRLRAHTSHSVDDAQLYQCRPGTGSEFYLDHGVVGMSTISTLSSTWNIDTRSRD